MSKSGFGLDSNVAAALAYVFGPIGGAVFLVVEKNDAFVRFHALQSILTFVGIAVLHVVVRNLPLMWWMATPMMIMTAVLWVFLIIKAFMRERYKLPVIGDIVERQLASRAR